MARARKHVGYSVSDMATYLGVNRNTVGNWINDRFAPSAPALRLWAQLCGVPYEWLRNGEAPDQAEASSECAIRDLNPEPAD